MVSLLCDPHPKKVGVFYCFLSLGWLYLLGNWNTMGCNCKGGKRQVLNNLQSADHINLARQTYNDIILQRPIQEYSDLDKFELFNTFRELYPNAKLTPSIENVVENIKHAVLNYDK